MSEGNGVPRLLTTKQLADATGLPLWRWYSLLKEGKGPPHMRVGRTMRFSEPAVMQWIAEQSNINNEETEQ